MASFCKLLSRKSFFRHHTRSRVEPNISLVSLRVAREQAMSTRHFIRVFLATTRRDRSRAFTTSPLVRSVDTNTGAGIDDVLHHHGREDMHFRSEDVRLLQGLVNKAKAQTRARAVDKAKEASSTSNEAIAHDLEALENIVGKDTLTPEVLRRVVAWKRGSFNQAPEETTTVW